MAIIPGCLSSATVLLPTFLMRVLVSHYFWCLQIGDQEGLTFTDYKPAKLSYGKQHPDAVVETASLAAVEPPDVTYELHLEDQVEEGTLSGLQLESIVYACQRHEHYLPDGSRAGFFIGDGEACN